MAVAGDETSGASGSGLPAGASAVASSSTGLVGAASVASASSLKTRHSIFIRTVSSYTAGRFVRCDRPFYLVKLSQEKWACDFSVTWSWKDKGGASSWE